ncbi:MAG: glucose-1-phosphate adenylyltransferase [Thermotogae bacterium]|nr:glucose-1-phosphate adenylyltransferase [Thermotogota bacterium]RKX46814.1 MAG: glucose-1-phosphate adenylyltransferase [Thermotogota bacterium]
MNTVALILAGGQGTRLGILTEDIAKPAVPFGGKYRIIDFTLSNCVNSGIYTVGVLTQYRPHVLINHIGIGRPWDLDRKDGGLTILPPFLGRKESDWYSGTANAVYQNIRYVDQYNPRYVLVLSGDHIYSMDYNELLDYHISKRAQGTVACMEVPINEASRFGIMVTDADGRIVEFQEKPKEPKSNLASLGIYVFNWPFLRDVLIEDEEDPKSTHDFGRDIITKLVSENDVKLYAFRFDGYWKDVGTLESYWESNLELTHPLPPLNLYDPNWRFYTHSEEMQPAYIGSKASVVDSLVSEGAEIYGTVENAVLFQGVFVEEGAVVRNSIIMTHARIERGAQIEDTIVCERAVIGEDVKIGIGEDAPSKLDPKVYTGRITVVGFDTVVPAGVSIGKNAVIGNGVRPENFASLTVEPGGFVL